MKYLFYYLFFIAIVLVFAYINSMPTQEPFTDGVRAYYRPIVRRSRLALESFQEQASNQYNETIQDLSKKLGFGI